MTFADHIIDFNKNLVFNGRLPDGIRIMNPFRENPEINGIMEQFYKKYYNDSSQRRMILGINPGRLGSGATGVPFTDTKRMAEKCGITIRGFKSHEPSSVFIYDVIDAYGGVKAFYKKFYISSICPLGFTRQQPGGKEINYNYYDSPALTKAVTPFIISHLRSQLTWNIDTSICYVMGTGKNASFFEALNKKEQLFQKVVPLEHPRFVMQYKSKTKEEYVNKYITALEL